MLYDKDMNKVVVVLLILVIFLGGWWLYRQPQVKDGFTEMKVGEVEVKVMIRDTMEGRSKGLSGYEKLEEDEGMLFVFPVLGKYGFWMKEMKFDLDVLWIKDDKVVGIIEGVKAPKEGESPVRFKPETMVNKVLEVNSGWAKKAKVKVGDSIKY